MFQFLSDITWWDAIGVVLWLAVAFALANMLFRDRNTLIVAELGVAVLYVVLSVFGWIDPGKPVKRTYDYAMTNLKSLGAEDRIRSRIEASIKSNAAAQVITRDTPQALEVLTFFVSRSYRLSKYRQDLDATVRDHVEAMVRIHAIRYMARTDNKSAFTYFMRYAKASGYVADQKEQACMRLVMGHPFIFDIARDRLPNDLIAEVNTAAARVIVSSAQSPRPPEDLLGLESELNTVFAIASKHAKAHMIATKDAPQGMASQVGRLCPSVQFLADEIQSKGSERGGLLVRAFISRVANRYAYPWKIPNHLRRQR